MLPLQPPRQEVGDWSVDFNYYRCLALLPCFIPLGFFVAGGVVVDWWFLAAAIHFQSRVESRCQCANLLPACHPVPRFVITTCCAGPAWQSHACMQRTCHSFYLKRTFSCAQGKGRGRTSELQNHAGRTIAWQHRCARTPILHAVEGSTVRTTGGGSTIKAVYGITTHCPS